MIRSYLALWFFDREVAYLDIPLNDEIFAGLIHKAPPEVVPALYQTRYYEDYFLLAKYFAPKSILEIGTRFGYSLIAMCKGAKPSRIVSIDMQSYENCFQLPTQQVARQNLDACIGAEASREFIVGDSHVVEISEKFDLIHVDGDHTEIGARDDVLKFYELLNPGGVMLVDDLDQPPVLAGFKLAVEALKLPPERVAFHAHKHGVGMIHRPE